MQRDVGRIRTNQVLGVIRVFVGGGRNTDIIRVARPFLEHLRVKAQRRMFVGHAERLILIRLKRHGCIVFFLPVKGVGNRVHLAVHRCFGNNVDRFVLSNELRQIDVARPGCRGIRRIVAHGQYGFAGAILHADLHLNLLRAQAVLIVRIVPDLRERELHNINAVFEAEGVTRSRPCHGEVAVAAIHNLIADEGFFDDIRRFYIFGSIPHIFRQIAEQQEAILQIPVGSQRHHVQRNRVADLAISDALLNGIQRRSIRARQLEGQKLFMNAQQLQQRLDVLDNVLLGFDGLCTQRPLLLYGEIHPLQRVGDDQIILIGVRGIIHLRVFPV